MLFLMFPLELFITSILSYLVIVFDVVFDVGLVALLDVVLIVFLEVGRGVFPDDVMGVVRKRCFTR